MADIGHRFSIGSKKSNGRRAVKCKSADKGCPVRGMLSSDEELVVLNVSNKIFILPEIFTNSYRHFHEFGDTGGFFPDQ